MAYMKKIYRFANAIEVQEYHSGRYGAPGMGRQKKQKPTPEQIKKKNQRHKTDTCSAVPLEDHLMFDPKANISRIAAPDARGSKAAKLIYEIQKSIPAPVTDNDGIFLNLTDIKLITGRHHQIRVQMSNANLPILGDKKYAPEYVQTVSKLLKVPHTALCACELCFTHPVTNDIIDLRVEPQGMWYSFFKN